MNGAETSEPRCQRRILEIRWHDFVRNSEVSLRTGLAPVSDRITRGRNAIFGHVARLPENIPAHQVELSVGRPQTPHGNVHQVDHVPNGPTNSAAITTMLPLRLCGGKLLVAATQERRYGPSRLRVNNERRRLVGPRIHVLGRAGFPTERGTFGGHTRSDLPAVDILNFIR